MSDFCSLSIIFWSLLLSRSLLGHAPSFFGHFSHDTIIVAPSLSFQDVLKSSYLMLFSCRKTQKKTKKKCSAFQNLLPHISTVGALWNIFQTDSETYSAGLQLSFFAIFGHWSCDQQPNSPLHEP